MTDDIIRKATTADYIETIDNLRAEVERLQDRLNMLKEHNFVDATPDGSYALRIMQSYREMCNCLVSDSIDAPPTNPLCIEMNRVNELRKAELDKAISDLSHVDAWKAKAIEERAKSMYPFDGVFTWTDLPEDDRVDTDCPIVTICGKTHWRNAAARELEEEQ